MKCKQIIYLFIFSFLLLFFANKVGAQFTIKGKVRDKITKEPLELAAVTDIKTGKNTLTDKHGNFILNMQNDHALLSITFIGYQSVVINAVNGISCLIQLEKGPVGSERSYYYKLHWLRQPPCVQPD